MTMLTPSRAFAGPSGLVDDTLALSLAPALTPQGLDPRPSFFHGFVTRPQVLARGLLSLADITATNYVTFTPSHLRDPVLTAHGDRLRAECFSACNGVYARLDLLGEGLDGGDIHHGTTNVDINLATRAALARVGRSQLLHVDVGYEGLRLSSPERTSAERSVAMPDRWVRALGNVTALHRGLPRAFSLGAAQARQLLASLPASSSRSQDGWLVPATGGARLLPRSSSGGVRIAGLHRLSALRRLMTLVTGLTAYGAAEPGPAVLELELPAARFTVGLTDDAWRGHSGEGSLLHALADGQSALEADLVLAELAFEPVIDVGSLSRASGLPPARVERALAVLGASGRAGWDLSGESWYHRELPHDPSRVDKDNPRLVRARALVEASALTPVSRGEWRVRGSRGVDHVVTTDHLDGPACTCAWYLKHGRGRGPCAHVLAVQIVGGSAGSAPSGPAQQENP